jgi:Putative addiction module component
VTVKEELHQWIDRLSDEQACDLLEDLRDPSDKDGPSLDEEALASLDLGLADIASNRIVSFEEFERELYEWQIRELERRKANLVANPESVTDWETVKRHVRERNRSSTA